MAYRFPEGPGRRPGQDPIADLLAAAERLFTRIAGAWGSSGGGNTVGRRISPWMVVPVVLFFYLLTGIYIVAPDQRAVVLRFGKIAREAEPGPHYRLPWPFEEVLRPSVTQIRKEEVGFRTVAAGPPAQYREVNDEALMLTGDENIVKLEFIVQYKIRIDATGTTDYLFNVRNPDETLREVAEAAMREVIGRNDIDNALTEGKERIQTDAQAVLQAILDRYGVGIDVVTVKLQDVGPPDQVNDAFKDVISAQQDKERLINESLGYANDVVPKARGQAAQLLNEAQGYREAKVRDATGVAQRFVALHEAYAQAKEVTRRRLYLETMEQILPRVNKIVLDEVAGKEVVPYLPLEHAIRPRRPEPEPAPGGRP
jgi:membrane protease subunit HflK